MNDVCSIELLRNAVARGLSADEETALHAHLEHCEACCAQMEQLAGGEAWQQEAAALLSADELDAAVPEPANWSEVDFSIDHLDPSDDANVLGQLGGYDVLAIVGRGGMGVVLKAFDRELKRLVAIKTLAPHLAHSSVARKRFAREAQAAAAVVNPHVIAIHHVQPTGRLPFLIMPLLTGESLAQRLKARGPLELTEVLRIGMQAAAGLAAAHDQGLVHRDVKPANIFLEKGVERVVITDFGLARAADDVSMTRMGVVAGTPEYMSPEQARGEALDGRSDLFSLGCVLYEMATGVSPFRTDSTMATLRRIVDEQPAAMASLVPELPPWFSHIVERLLSKAPAQRFASASEVSQLLEQCLSHLQQPTSVSLPASLVPHAAGRRSIFKVTRKGVIAMLGTIGMTLLGLVLWQATEAPDISGQWTSEEWGTVVLEEKQPGRYQGTMTDSLLEVDPYPVQTGKTGKIELEWSRLEQRFNGTFHQTWDQPWNLSGKLSIRVVDNEIRGAWSTEKDAPTESGKSRLADLLWTRTQEEVGKAIAAPGLTETKTASVVEAMHLKLPVTKESSDYRVTLLGLTRAVSPEFTASDGISGGNRPLSWMRAVAMIERLGEMDGPYGFDAQATDGQKQIEKLKVRSTSELDLDSSHLARELSPITVPKLAPAARGKIYMFTISGVFQATDLATLRFQFGTPARQQEVVFENVPIPAVVREPGIEKPLDRQNARAVVEAFVAAMLSGDVETARILAKSSPGMFIQRENTARNLDRKHLAMKSVYVNDPANPTKAMAISEVVKLKEKPPNGQHDGFRVRMLLSMGVEGWVVTDIIDFESEESAERELKKFLEANPKSISVPPQREAQARAARANPLVGHWKVVKLADMPVDQLAGATVVIDEHRVKMQVPSQKGPHPDWRYTLGANGEIDLADADDVKGESNVRAKYSLKGNTLCLALNAKKGDHPRPESATGEAPQDGMLYIVLELDETAKSSEAAKASDEGHEKREGNQQGPEQPALSKTLQQLQGKWRLTREIAPDGDEEGTPGNSVWEFKGDRIITRDPAGTMLIQVDESHSPVHVDLLIETEDEYGFGLLSVENDKLTLCLGKPQKTPLSKSRPEKLQWVSGVVYMELRRVKPGETIVPLKPKSQPQPQVAPSFRASPVIPPQNRVDESNAPAVVKPTTDNPGTTSPNTRKMPPEKEHFTAWGEEVNGVQIGVRLGEQRIYEVGENVTLILRLRNNGKVQLPYRYGDEYFLKNPPLITDASGKAVTVKAMSVFGKAMEKSVAPGKEVDLVQLQLDLRPATDRSKDAAWTIYGTGKFQIQYPVTGVVGEVRPDLLGMNLVTGKLELEVKKPFTAWGKEVGGLQAGLGFKAGEKRAYSHGEKVKLVVRVRNVGKEEAKFDYIPEYFIENPPTVLDEKAKAVSLAPGLVDTGVQIGREANLAPGKEIELAELTLEFSSRNEAGTGFLKSLTIYGTGKFQVGFENVLGTGFIKPNPALSKLATGNLELEVKEPEKMPPEKEPFTAWGEEVNGVQIGVRLGEQRIYEVGENVTLILRLRNDGKVQVPYRYGDEYFLKNPPLITDASGKAVTIKAMSVFGSVRL